MASASERLKKFVRRRCVVICDRVCRARARTAGAGMLTPRVCLPPSAACATASSSTLFLRRRFRRVGKRSMKPCRSMPVNSDKPGVRPMSSRWVGRPSCDPLRSATPLGSATPLRSMAAPPRCCLRRPGPRR
eukprot:4368271-Lingulodinium_polyedra.AAC.1